MKTLPTYKVAVLLLSFFLFEGKIIAQVIAEESLSFTGNVELVKTIGGRLWTIQKIAQNGSVGTYTLAFKINNTWTRVEPNFQAEAQDKQNIEFKDLEIFNDRYYISGNFMDPTSRKYNCLLAYNIVSKKFLWEFQFTNPNGTAFPSVNSLLTINNAMYMGGAFRVINGTEVMNVSRLNKKYVAEKVLIDKNVGADGPVNSLVSTANDKGIYFGGFFRHFLGKSITGLAEYIFADTSNPAKVKNENFGVFRLKRFGSILLAFAVTDTMGKSGALMYKSNDSLMELDGLDSLYHISNFFAVGSDWYFSGIAKISGDTKYQGIFKITSKAYTTPYRNLNRVAIAESYLNQIYVAGSFISILNSVKTEESFKFGAIQDKFKRFTAQVFADLDGNGKFSAGDIPLSQRTVRVFPYNTILPIYKLGLISFIIPDSSTATFKLFIEGFNNEFLNSVSYFFKPDSITNRLYYIPIKFKKASYTDVEVNLTSAAGWKGRSDTSELYIIRISNKGLTTVKPHINFHFNQAIKDVKPLSGQVTINNNLLTWQDITLDPGDEKSYGVRLTMPSNDFKQNQVVSFSTSVSNVLDDNPNNNSDTLNQTIVAGVDDIVKYQYPAIPSGETYAWLANDAKKIDYVIRFNNFTNDTVRTVVVRDTVSTPYYTTYIQETGASHPFTRNVYTNPSLPDKVIVVYTFQNLSLPPSYGNSEVVGSSGYIGFRVGFIPILPSGIDIVNRATVLLDGTGPIYTNAVVAKVATTSAKSIHRSGIENMPYPNPFQNDLTFPNVSSGSVLSVYSLDGRKVFQENIFSSGTFVAKPKLNAGSYFYTLEEKDKSKTSGIIIKE